MNVNHDGRVGGLLAVLVSLNGLASAIQKVEPLLGSLLTLVQIVVGIASAYYFFRKARAVVSNKEDAKPRRKHKCKS